MNRDAHVAAQDRRRLALLALGCVAIVTGAIAALAEADVLGRQGHHVAAFALGAFAIALPAALFAFVWTVSE